MGRIHSSEDARRLARRRLPWMVFDYIDGAAGREVGFGEVFGDDGEGHGEDAAPAQPLQTSREDELRHSVSEERKAATHPGHRGEKDSQWAQWRLSADLYAWARARGTYLNIPDYYFLVGSNKVAMGYREVNWSLPRERQIILGRQNIYDGTWEKTPSMGWMFRPICVILNVRFINTS